MEFLMGRALGNNLINLTVYDQVKEALEEVIGAAVLSFRKRNPDISVTVSVPDSVLMAMIDPVLIQQVLQTALVDTDFRKPPRKAPGRVRA